MNSYGSIYHFGIPGTDSPPTLQSTPTDTGTR